MTAPGHSTGPRAGAAQLGIDGGLTAATNAFRGWRARSERNAADEQVSDGDE